MIGIVIAIVVSIVVIHAVERHENYRDYRCDKTHSQYDCR